MAAGEFHPAIWLKLDPKDPNSHMLLSHGGLIITEDPRFSVSYNEDDNVYVLQVRRAERNGRGERGQGAGREGRKRDRKGRKEEGQEGKEGRKEAERHVGRHSRL